MSSDRPAAPRPPPPAAFVVELPPAGDLSFFDAPRIVGWSIVTRFSGCLWLAPSAPFSPPLNALTEDASPHRELYLENGGLIGALSTLPGDGLLEFLLPLWSRQQAQRARAVVSELSQVQPREQLAALADARLIKRASMTAHLAGYINALSCRALAPSPGRYRVLSRALTNSERIELALPLRRILVEGLRKGASLEFLQQRLGPPTTCLRPTAVIGAAEGGAALLDAGLSSHEESALTHFNGRLNLAEIVERSHLAEHAVYVLGYALLCLGAAAVPRVPTKPVPRPGAAPASAASAGTPAASQPPPTQSAAPAAVQPSTPAPSQPATPPAAQQAAPTPSQPPASQPNAAGDVETAMRRVQQKFRQVEEANYFALLELQPGASIADVERAHQALRAEFLPTALPYRCRSSMDRELRQIARALDEAKNVLGNEATLRSYSSQLATTGGGQ